MARNLIRELQRRVDKVQGTSATSDSASTLSAYEAERRAQLAYLYAKHWEPSIRQVSEVLAEPRMAALLSLCAADPKSDGAEAVQLAVWSSTTAEAARRAIAELLPRHPNVRSVVERNERKRAERMEHLQQQRGPAPTYVPEAKTPSVDDPELAKADAKASGHGDKPSADPWASYSKPEAPKKFKREVQHRADRGSCYDGWRYRDDGLDGHEF